MEENLVKKCSEVSKSAEQSVSVRLFDKFCLFKQTSISENGRLAWDFCVYLDVATVPFVFSNQSIKFLNTNKTNLVVYVIPQGWRQSKTVYNSIHRQKLRFMHISCTFTQFSPCDIFLCSCTLNCIWPSGFTSGKHARFFWPKQSCFRLLKVNSSFCCYVNS